MRTIFAAAWLALFAGSALAQQAAPQPRYAQMPAHPALWTVHGPKGTAYLLGSIHVLPPQVAWHTKEIDAAMAKADVFVFEIAMDDKFQQNMMDAVKARGYLPEGKHLHDLLSPAEGKALDDEVVRLKLSPETVDRMRPWFASVTFDVMDAMRQNYSAAAGVDMQVQSEIAGQPVLGLETADQQLAMLAPDDPKTELESLEATLKTSGARQDDEMGPLLDAWMNGRPAEIARLTTKDLAPYPQAEKLLLDDRNTVWVKKIAALLDEPKTYFITVGAAHLAGPRGVPALLRAKGFHVEGP